MADETDNLVLEHLRAIREEVSSLRSEQRERLDSIETRLQALELQVNGLHSTNAEFRGRFERIERRLDLVDAGE